MKTLYSLLGITLLSSVALTSCKDDEIPNSGGNKEEVAPYTVTATVTDFAASEVATALQSRANAQANGVINWAEGDKFLMWNKRNSGAYEFTMAEGSDLTAKTVSFTGEAAVKNEDVLLGFYPKKDFVVVEDGIQFALSASATQTTGQPELQQSLLMAATATMSEGQISEFVFKPVVSLFNFTISNNTTYSSLKIKSVEVTSEKEIFPTVVALNQNAETFKLSGNVNSLEFSMNEQELVQGSVIDGMMCVLPYDKEIEETEFMATVEAVNGETPVIFEFTLPVQSLTNDTKKFEAGKIYKFGLELNETVEVPEEGYKVTEEGDWFVYTADGLAKWMSEGDKTKDLTLMKDMDMTGKAWTSVAEFSGVLDGKGHTISNLTNGLITKNTGTVQNLILMNASAKGENAAIIASTNDGTIKNISLNSPNVEGTTVGTVTSVNNSIIENVTLKDVTVSNGKTVGSVAAENNGTISNCHVVGGTLNGTGTPIRIGGIVGANKRIISGTSVESLNINALSDGESNVGGLIGKNEAWVSSEVKVTNSYVDKNVAITVSGGNTNRLGGFVGSHWRGVIDGCYSVASITSNTSTKIGGFVGLIQVPADSELKKIMMCFANCTINNTGTGSVTGDFIGESFNANANITSCYSLGVLPNNGTKNGFVGVVGGSTSPTFSNCYTINNVQSRDGINKVESIEDLRSKAEAMNAAASESGFIFVEGETDEEPLVIVKKEANE